MTQEQALSILKSGESVFLTGEPGAGKTHTVNAYVQYLRAHDIEPAITASTGIAATHIRGMTIHSWSGIAIKHSLSKDDLDKMMHNKFLYRRLTKTQVLIIDEVSMLSARTLEMAELVCRTIRQNTLPFGGMQVVLVGDFFQLPPVSRAGEERAGFAFESEAWRQLNPTVCYLTEQHRQDDPDFLGVLSALRAGQYTDEHRAHLQGRVGRHEKVVHELPRLFPHNVSVDVINDRELKKLSGDEKEFLMQESGSERYIEALKRGCLSPERLVLKIGASVMCTKNNLEDGFINGTVGTVARFSKDGGLPIIKLEGGKEILIEPMEWTVEEDGKVKAKISQLPLRLAWAMTIHKSQGMSMDSAVIDLSGAFEFGQGYVALSRVRRLSGLYLLGFNERSLQVHPEVLERDEEFRQRSAATTAGLEQRTNSQREQLFKDFIIACGGKVASARTADSENESSSKSGEGSEWLAQKREKHPNAYQPWTAENDDLLRTMFEAEIAMPKIAEFFKRNSGSIRSRLRKLGLID
jgi:ATP-dependent DNA helicase PIF1